MQRELPSWMTRDSEKNVESKESLVQKKESLTGAKRGVARSVFYCMNERELVEEAMKYLSADGAFYEDQQVRKDKVMNNIGKTHINPIPEAFEDVSSESDSLERTYVSESDVDISEVETMPYSGFPAHQQTGSDISSVSQDHRDPGLETDRVQICSQTPAAADEDEAFRLVRDIFFT